MKRWNTNEAGSGNLENEEVKPGGEQSLGGGVTTLQGLYVDDRRLHHAVDYSLL